MNVLFLSDTLSQLNDKDFGISKLPRNTQKSKCEGDYPLLEYLKITDDALSSSDFFKDVNFLKDDFTDKYIIFYDVVDGKKSFNNLIKSKRILSDLKNKKCYVLFFHTDCVSWQFNSTHEYWSEFKKLVNEQNIDTDRFGFIMYETILKSDSEMINEIGIDLYSFNNTSKSTYYPDQFAKSSKLDKNTLIKMFQLSRGYYRQFKYCSHNNNIKDHRVELLLFLIKENILDSGITTWFAGNEPIEQGVNKLDLTKFDSVGNGVIDYSEKYGKEVIDIAQDLIPNSYDYKVDGLQDFLNVLPYFNSYFNIISETTWGPSYDFVKPQKIHITEKVWKPVSTFQPFILISTKNNLNKLREWGFKTFDGFIDESYDELDTYGERVDVINKEIIRLCSMSRKELDDWYWSMEDILQHNSDNLVRFIDSEYSKMKEVFKMGWSKV
tara:strand:- start:7779 stop:9092 length:1314 start_codon:yes stop_codon:yes gene_type:complete